MRIIQTTRADGRTNTEVILELVNGVEAGETFSYGQLAAALSAGSARHWDRRAVQGAVRVASRRLLKQEARTLYPVRGVGYRLSRGSEHHGLALRREHRASVQMRQSVDLLTHANHSEMSASERSIHEAHLTITAALWTQMRRVTQKQKQQDDAISSLLTRVDKLEAR